MVPKHLRVLVEDQVSAPRGRGDVADEVPPPISGVGGAVDLGPSGAGALVGGGDHWSTRRRGTVTGALLIIASSQKSAGSIMMPDVDPAALARRRSSSGSSCSPSLFENTKRSGIEGCTHSVERPEGPSGSCRHESVK